MCDVLCFVEHMYYSRDLCNKDSYEYVSVGCITINAVCLLSAYQGTEESTEIQFQRS
jgi:hypothetical protein